MNRLILLAIVALISAVIGRLLCIHLICCRIAKFVIFAAAVATEMESTQLGHLATEIVSTTLGDLATEVVSILLHKRPCN